MGHSRAIFGHLGSYLGHFGSFLGHFVAFLDKFAERSIFLQDRWGPDTCFQNVCLEARSLGVQEESSYLRCIERRAGRGEKQAGAGGPVAFRGGFRGGGGRAPPWPISRLSSCPSRYQTSCLKEWSHNCEQNWIFIVIVIKGHLQKKNLMW